MLYIWPSNYGKTIFLFSSNYYAFVYVTKDFSKVFLFLEVFSIFSMFVSTKS
jgi:hypothetical protein